MMFIIFLFAKLSFTNTSFLCLLVRFVWTAVVKTFFEKSEITKFDNAEFRNLSILWEYLICFKIFNETKFWKVSKSQRRDPKNAKNQKAYWRNFVSFNDSFLLSVRSCTARWSSYKRGMQLYVLDLNSLLPHFCNQLSFLVEVN